MPCELKGFIQTDILAAILGALVTVLITYWFSLRINFAQSKSIAIAKLRAVFAPTLAFIDIFQRSNEIGTAAIDNYVAEVVRLHAAATEEFRPFASNSIAYQEAWNRYYQLATEPTQAFVEDQQQNFPKGGSLVKAINHFLCVAQT